MHVQLIRDVIHPWTPPMEAAEQMKADELQVHLEKLTLQRAISQVGL